MLVYQLVSKEWKRSSQSQLYFCSVLLHIVWFSFSQNPSSGTTGVLVEWALAYNTIQFQVAKSSISWTLLVGLVSHYHLYAEQLVSTVVWITHFDSPYSHAWLLKVWKSHTDLPGTISMFWNSDKHCAILLYYRRRQIIQSLLKFRIRKMAVCRQYMN